MSIGYFKDRRKRNQILDRRIAYRKVTGKDPDTEVIKKKLGFAESLKEVSNRIYCALFNRGA